MTQIKELENFKDYGRVVSISNGIIEAYVTVDVGPRIIRFGYVGGQNIMYADRIALGSKTDKEFTDFFGKDKKWESFGGHRIWISPEAYPQTYYPDDSKVEYQKTDCGAVFTPKAETENGVAKQLEIKMDKDTANMQVTMRVKNISKESIEFAIWRLSVSNQDGTVIIPMNDNDTGLLSNRIISVWPYTDMNDNRIYWGKKYVTLSQDTNAIKPAKLGFDLNKGTVYYVLGDDIFRKSYAAYHPTAKYPDGGCSFETYTNNLFIEVESLGELKEVKSGEISEHTENWSLYKKPCEVDFKDDNSIDNLLSKI